MDDSDIEKRLMNVQLLQHTDQKDDEFLEPLDKKTRADLIDRVLKLESKQDEHNQYIDLLTEEIMQQEIELRQQKKKLREFESQIHEMFMQSIIAQNSESVKELASICKIDENAVYDPRELEGILSTYSDAQSSVEWIRSVRDSS